MITNKENIVAKGSEFMEKGLPTVPYESRAVEKGHPQDVRWSLRENGVTVNSRGRGRQWKVQEARTDFSRY